MTNVPKLCTLQYGHSGPCVHAMPSSGRYNKWMCKKVVLTPIKEK